MWGITYFRMTIAINPTIRARNANLPISFLIIAVSSFFSIDFNDAFVENSDEQI